MDNGILGSALGLTVQTNRVASPEEPILVPEISQSTQYTVDQTANVCLFSNADREKAIAACKANYVPPTISGVGAVRSVYSGAVTDPRGRLIVGCYPGKDYNCFEDFDPCVLARLPTCDRAKPPPSDTPDEVFVDEGPPLLDQGDDDDSKMIVGGLLALILIGGGGYYMYQRRKKRR